MDTLQQIETKAFLELIEVMKKLEIDLGIARERIAQLEAQLYGGPTKWPRSLPKIVSKPPANTTLF